MFSQAPNMLPFYVRFIRSHCSDNGAEGVYADSTDGSDDDLERSGVRVRGIDDSHESAPTSPDSETMGFECPRKQAGRYGISMSYSPRHREHSESYSDNLESHKAFHVCDEGFKASEELHGSGTRGTQSVTFQNELDGREAPLNQPIQEDFDGEAGSVIGINRLPRAHQCKQSTYHDRTEGNGNEQSTIVNDVSMLIVVNDVSKLPALVMRFVVTLNCSQCVLMHNTDQFSECA